MESLQCIALGFIPGIFWLWFLRRYDDHEPEPWAIVLLAFVLGGLSTYAVLWVRPSLEGFLPDAERARDLADAFLLTGPLEETVKLLAFVAAVSWHRQLDEPLDGIIYGSAVGLGFASVENAYYLAFGDIPVLIQRGFTSTLVHVSTSGTMGFFLGLTRFSPRRHRLWLVVVGLLLAVVFHGTYNAFLSPGGLPWVSLLLVLPAMLLLLSMKIQWAREQSEDYH